MIVNNNFPFKNYALVMKKLVSLIVMLCILLPQLSFSGNTDFTNSQQNASTFPNSSNLPNSSSEINDGSLVTTKICSGCPTVSKEEYAKKNNCRFLEDVCPPGSLDKDNKGAPDEDQGFWGSMWSDIKEGLKGGYQFVKGLVAGLKDQVAGLIDALFNIDDALAGLIKLGQEFLDNPKETLKNLAKILGQDVIDAIQQATLCGPYGTGYALGNNITPVLAVKLASKLKLFKSFEKAADGVVEDLKKIGCPVPFKKASFVAGTPIVTVNGLQSIEEIKVGTVVLSRNENTYIDKPQKVTRIMNRVAPSYHVLVTDIGQFEVTEEHPLWVQGHGWTPVKDLQSRDVVATRTGDATITNNISVDEPVKVFNFTVANTHNYFVGGTGLWAHNAGGGNVACGAQVANVFQYITKTGKKTAYILENMWMDGKGKLLWIDPLTAGLKKVPIPKNVNIHIDHIFPQAKFDSIPGFKQLPDDIKKKLINDPKNLQPMVSGANCSKRCSIESENGGWQKWGGKDVHPDYKKYLDDHEQFIRDEVAKAVKAHKASQGG